MELSHNAVCHVFTMLSIARLRSEAFLFCQVLLSAHDGETGLSENIIVAVKKARI